MTFNNGRPPDINKAARCGEPSYVWRAGQQRRLNMILDSAGERLAGHVLENGCGIGTYLEHLAPLTSRITGLEYDFDRVREASQTVAHQPNVATLCAAGEELPFPEETFDLILSHEVLEHVRDDHLAVKEMVRTLKGGGRMLLFTPNRGYPFETHGIFWRGSYRFGNIPLVNYLPLRLRNRLAPHVRIYSRKDMCRLIDSLPVKVVSKSIIFGAYDNIIARWPLWGKLLRSTLHLIEHTPFRILGLSHFWVVEKVPPQLEKSPG